MNIIDLIVEHPFFHGLPEAKTLSKKHGCNPMTPRPIETAPKDWSLRVLLIDFKIAKEWQIGAWNRFRNCWLDDYDYEVFPTHWLPLPPP